MNSKHIFAIAAVLVGAALVFTFFDGTEAQSSPAALTGVVSSPQEAQMEGVLVSAKRVGSTVTTTVSTDAQGRYTFPRTRLEPGTCTDSHSRDWVTISTAPRRSRSPEHRPRSSI